MVTAYAPAIHTKADQIARLKLLGWAVNEYVEGYHLSDTLARFQAAHLTRAGMALDVDGEYGPQTEAALFETYIPFGATLVDRLLAVAASQVGVREVPKGSNKGPQIDIVLKGVGLGPGYPWCAAEFYWWMSQACRQMNVKNPVPKTAGVLNLWDLAGYKESGLTRITAAEARANPKLIEPGMQFLLKLSSTAGHTGVIEKVLPKNRFVTIEGNTYDRGSQTGSREGELTGRLEGVRSVDNINLGYIKYH